MICQKYIARCYRVYQHERNENASFLSIFNDGGRPKWRFSNFPRFWKNSSALGSFNCIFENNSLKALFGQNIKKLKILKLSRDSRYLQKLALKHFLEWKWEKLPRTYREAPFLTLDHHLLDSSCHPPSLSSSPRAPNDDNVQSYEPLQSDEPLKLTATYFCGPR